MPDEAKLNENEDGNAFAGPYVPSPPPDHSHVLNQMLVELQRIRKEVRSSTTRFRISVRSLVDSHNRR